ncbi:YdcF family protein [Erythrobacter sp. W53]|uniref:YdcF family protein n=1 Tax=Erythrobacteraceae TaxID=335929 RepID=UPI0036D3DC7F
MILRFFASIVLIYAVGFLAFATTLPGPISGAETDAVIVPTGGAGRIARGLAVVRSGKAEQMFVSGVDPEVTEQEFANQFKVTRGEMRCCVKLGYLAVDTRSNAGEASQWLAENEFTSVRLVTTDWHMRRTASEFRDVLPGTISLVEDAVPSKPNLGTLFLEYNKLIAAVVLHGWPS